MDMYGKLELGKMNLSDKFTYVDMQQSHLSKVAKSLIFQRQA